MKNMNQDFDIEIEGSHVHTEDSQRDPNPPVT